MNSLLFSCLQGTYTVHANIYNQNKKELACIDVMFQVNG